MFYVFYVLPVSFVSVRDPSLSVIFPYYGVIIFWKLQTLLMMIFCFLLVTQLFTLNSGLQVY